MFVVYRNSEGGTKVDHMGYNDYNKALECCEAWGWEMPDENGFVWYLTIEEESGNADDYYISDSDEYFDYTDLFEE